MRLDVAFPDSPKVLITGLAESSDMLAAEVALERPTWLVVGLLPLPIQTYLGTMSNCATRQQFLTLLEHPRVRHRTLAPLMLTEHEVRSPDLAACSQSSLHYEQLGLCLAEHATVLLTILPRGK